MLKYLKNKSSSGFNEINTEFTKKEIKKINKEKKRKHRLIKIPRTVI